MATMGRKRKNNPLGLPDRVYANHGAFYYVHRDGRWEPLGTDVDEAKRKGRHYNDPADTYGTMAWYLDQFVLHCEKLVGQATLARRTYEDYKRDVEPLKAYFGRMMPIAIEAHHKAAYLDLGRELERGVRANRESACMSACMSWMARTKEGGLKANPWYRAGIRRNKETPRDRYVEHEEYQLTWAQARKQVRGLMALVYRTLQRPEDIILWTPADILRKREADGTVRRVIRSKQGKTGANVDIAITPEIEAILADLKVAEDVSTGPGMTLIHTQHGKPYTYDGLCAMLKRAIAKANGLDTGRLAKTKNAGRDKSQDKVQSFGFYDLKGKGATDMWLNGIALERIQVLCGHESVTTTEIYVKRRWHGTVQPNQVALDAG